VSEIAGYLARVIVLPAGIGAFLFVLPLVLGERARLGRFALAGTAFALVATLAIEIGGPALVRSLPAGLGEAWGDPSLAPERWHQVAFVAAGVLLAGILAMPSGRRAFASRVVVAIAALAAAATIAWIVEFPGEDSRRGIEEFAGTLVAIVGMRVLSRTDVRRPSGPGGFGGTVFLWVVAALLAILAAFLMLVPFPSLAVAAGSAAGATSLMAIAAAVVTRRTGRPVVDGSGFAAVGFGTILATLAFAGLAYGREKVPEGLWLAALAAPWAGVLVTPIARACVHASASIAWRLIATAALPLAVGAPHLAREFLPSEPGPAEPASSDPMDGIYGS
jgi:hypothetical protein